MTDAGCRLEIVGLAKSYGAVPAVRSVDLDVPPAALLTLLGPSGCGKTTVLQAVAGFVSPDRGDIRIDGASVLAVPPERRRTAMLFQHYALFPHMSVAENVAFGLKMQGVAPPERQARVAEALRMVRIEELARRRPGELSGGQRQRVALARAVVTRPRVLLLDEPLGALDQNLREDMQIELRKLQQRLGITTVIVTHDQKEAIVLSDMIAVMNAGRIEQIGAPAQVHDHPSTEFVARFTGVENILDVEVLATATGSDIRLGGLALHGVAGAQPRTPKARLAVRAAAIDLHAAISEQAAGAAGLLPGRVGFSRLLGTTVRYEIHLADGRMLTVSAARRGEAPFAQGSLVGMAFHPGSCTVLEVP